MIAVNFFINFMYFSLAIFLAFYIPGALLLKQTRFTIFQKTVISIILGMVLWGFQGMVFGYLGLRWLSYIYLFCFLAVWLKIYWNGKLALPRLKLGLSGFGVLVSLIVIIGSIIQLSSVWFSGVSVPQGLYFCCGNISDNLYHIALTNELVKDFPPYEPGMYGVIVHNYHYWGNLVIAELVRIFKLPLLDTQFRYSMLFVSIMLGLTAIAFGQIAKMNKSYIVWFLFFLYFGADIIYIMTTVMRHEINFEMGSLEDGARFLSNPPRAFSVITFFGGLSLFLEWINKKDFKTGLLMSIIFGSLVSFKVYTGLFIAFGFCVLFVYFLYKKMYNMLIPIISSGILFLIVYLPVNSGAGGFYFTGLGLFENFIVQPWMTLDRLELARVIYVQHHSWIRVAEYELIYIFLYIFLIFGTKLLGFIQSKKSLSQFPFVFHLFMFSGLFASSILGFFFQQSSGGSNTFNFLVSVFIFGSIYTALACSYWLQNYKVIWVKIAIFFIILITMPRIAYNFYQNITLVSHEKGLVITSGELAGINYLRNHTGASAVIMTDDRTIKKDFADNGAPYISFLSDRHMFLSGNGILTSHGVDTSSRFHERNYVFKGTDVDKIKQILLKEHIQYIYTKYPTPFAVKQINSFIQPVFLGVVQIYKVTL